MRRPLVLKQPTNRQENARGPRGIEKLNRASQRIGGMSPSRRAWKAIYMGASVPEISRDSVGGQKFIRVYDASRPAG